MQAGADSKAGLDLRRARRWIAVMLLTAAALELGLRSFGMTPRLASVGDEHLGYVLLPNQRAVQDGVEHRINAQGFHANADWAAATGDSDSSVHDGGTRGLRVAVFDSSIGVGVGVHPRDAWPNTLQRLLESGGPSDETLVMNFAVGGYGVEQYRALYESQAAAYRPDIAVLVISDLSAVPLVVRGTPHSWVRPLLKRSLLYDLWSRVVTKDTADASPPPRTIEEAQRREAAQLYQSSPLTPQQERHWSAAQASIEAIHAAQSLHGGDTIVVFAPLVNHWLLNPNERRPRDWIAVREGWLAVDLFDEWSPVVHEWIARLEVIGVEPAEAAQIIADRSAGPLVDSGLPSWFLDGDPYHWSRSGHADVARRVALLIGRR